MQPKELVLQIRLSRDDREILEKLVKAWGVTLAEAVRRSVREAWKREAK